jgi:hypothetical protein
MGFQDRLDRKREEQAHAADARAKRATRERAALVKAAQERGGSLIQEVLEAAGALRSDRERSERLLMPQSGSGSRYGGLIGAIVRITRDEQPRAWYQLRPTYVERTQFGGWWVRYSATDSGPFELEIPLAGDPSVVRYVSNFDASPSDKKWTLEAFVKGGVYEYTRFGEDGPGRQLHTTADAVLSSALRIIEDHLLYLPG